VRNVIRSTAALAALVIAAPAFAADGRLGVELVERDGEVVILKVLPNTSAENVGIRPGDVLVKVNGAQIGSIQDALDAKEDADNNTDVKFVFRTPAGNLWKVKARFEKGKPYGKFTATEARPE
jgi:S1-C subfamily serine protease